MDLNTVTITGRLTANPELRYTNDGKAVTNMRVAVNDRTDFVDVTVWGKPAEAVAERKAKGDQIGVTGRLTTASGPTPPTPATGIPRSRPTRSSSSPEPSSQPTQEGDAIAAARRRLPMVEVGANPDSEGIAMRNPFVTRPLICARW